MAKSARTFERRELFLMRYGQVRECKTRFGAPARTLFPRPFANSVRMPTSKGRGEIILADDHRRKPDHEQCREDANKLSRPVSAWILADKVEKREESCGTHQKRNRHHAEEEDPRARAVLDAAGLRKVRDNRSEEENRHEKTDDGHERTTPRAFGWYEFAQLVCVSHDAQCNGVRSGSQELERQRFGMNTLS